MFEIFLKKKKKICGALLKKKKNALTVCSNVNLDKLPKECVTKKFTVMVVVRESVLFVIVTFCIS